MSQLNDSVSGETEIRNQPEENEAPVVKSEMASSDVNAEIKQDSPKDETDSSDRDTDSGLQVNSHEFSASGGDESPLPLADDNPFSVESLPSENDKQSDGGRTSQETDSCPTENDVPPVAQGDRTMGPNDSLKGPSSNAQGGAMDTTASVESASYQDNMDQDDPTSSHKAKENTASPASNDAKLEEGPVSTASKDISVEKNAASQATEASSNVTTTSAEGATASPVDPEEKSQLQSVYHVKWIRFKESLYPIITQNENGPCPLLAIMNLLILQGKIKLPPLVEMVTAGQLMEYLADCIFEHAPKNITEDAQLNYEQNMHDAMAVFHKLQTGLDVNVKFTSVSTFEYTPECIVFDLLGIPLYHGWLVDPDSVSEVAAVGNCGYNQLVEKIITQKNSSKEEMVTEALIAEDFLNRTASQLTYHGLSEMCTTLKDEQMCVFFRNNHFSTLYKHKNELFLLVTDQGFLTEGNVVWETLSNVEGDGHFVDADFNTYRKAEPSTHPIPQPAVPVGTDQQVDQDYLVALSLQQEQAAAAAAPSVPLGAQQPDMAMAMPPGTGAPDPSLTDHELALRLQEEENRQAKLRQQQLANQQHLSQQHQQRMALEAKEKKKDKSSDCVIL